TASSEELVLSAWRIVDATAADEIGLVVAKKNIVGRAALQVLNRNVDIASGIAGIGCRVQEICPNRGTAIIRDCIVASTSAEDIAASPAARSVGISITGKTVVMGGTYEIFD